jgi:hypothetical protein
MSRPQITVRIRCAGCRLVHLGHDQAEVQATVDECLARRPI